MEINRQNDAGAATLTLRGQLDSAWSESVNIALQQVLRDGLLEVRLDLTAVTYVSSAGLRVLLAQWKEFRRASGQLVIAQVSAEVERVLKLAGLSSLLGNPSGAATPTSSTRSPTSRLKAWNGPGFTGEIEEISKDARWRGKLINSTSTALPPVKFPVSTLGFGLGAFGSAEGKDAPPSGEFLAAGGCAVCLPPDGTNHPDYAVTEKALAPEVRLVNGFTAEGAFAHMTHFEAMGDSPGVNVSDLVACFLASAEGKPIAFAAVLETAALVGAHLRQPLAGDAAEKLFEFPAVRDWLTFTSEPAYPNTVALLVGVATRETDVSLANFTRPCGPQAGPRAHMHAAAFPYRPVRHGHLDPAQTISGLFESGRILGVLHLLPDRRPELGAGESRFYRGACWFSPLDLS